MFRAIMIALVAGTIQSMAPYFEEPVDAGTLYALLATETSENQLWMNQYE